MAIIMAESQNRTLTEQFMLRLPDGMRDRIKAAAEANNRSMNAEIIHRLQTTFEMDDYQPVENAHPDGGPPGGLFGLGAIRDKDHPLMQPVSPHAREIIRLLVDEMIKAERKR